MWESIMFFSVAVSNIEEGIEQYKGMFGLKQMSNIGETQFGFRSVMMGDGQKRFLEIVEPTNPDSALARFMKGRSRSQNPNGEGIHYIAVEVDDLEATVKQIRACGGKVAQEPEDPDVAWVHPLSLRSTFIELRRHQE
ncbi:VOC family protein [Chloroflexota bacterium]